TDAARRRPGDPDVHRAGAARRADHGTRHRRADPLDLLRRRSRPGHPVAARLDPDRADQLRYRARDVDAPTRRDDRRAGRVQPGGPGGTGPRPPAPGGTPYRRRGPRPRWGRIALVAGLAVLLLLGIGGFGAYLYASHLDDQINRTDPFSQITGGRPAKVASGAM